MDKRSSTSWKRRMIPKKIDVTDPFRSKRLMSFLALDYLRSMSRQVLIFGNPPKKYKLPQATAEFPFGCGSLLLFLGSKGSGGLLLLPKTNFHWSTPFQVQKEICCILGWIFQKFFLKSPKLLPQKNKVFALIPWVTVLFPHLSSTF